MEIIKHAYLFFVKNNCLLTINKTNLIFNVQTRVIQGVNVWMVRFHMTLEANFLIELLAANDTHKPLRLTVYPQVLFETFPSREALWTDGTLVQLFPRVAEFMIIKRILIRKRFAATSAQKRVLSVRQRVMIVKMLSTLKLLVAVRARIRLLSNLMEGHLMLMFLLPRGKPSAAINTTEGPTLR